MNTISHSRLLISFLLLLLGICHPVHAQYDFTASETHGYAPLHVKFSFISTASADTITSWYWDFGNGQSSTLAEPDTVIYATPGNYTPTLIFNGRVDLAIVKNDYITVLAVPSEDISIPNVFTPNGDNINDDFIVTTTANEPIRMNIFSRAGILVFKTEGIILTWDGYTASGQKLNPGIYYYAIEALGDDPTSKYSKSGFVYMYW